MLNTKLSPTKPWTTAWKLCWERNQTHTHKRWKFSKANWSFGARFASCNLYTIERRLERQFLKKRVAQNFSEQKVTSLYFGKNHQAYSQIKVTANIIADTAHLKKERKYINQREKAGWPRKCWNEMDIRTLMRNTRILKISVLYYPSLSSIYLSIYLSTYLGSDCPPITVCISTYLETSQIKFLYNTLLGNGAWDIQGC